MGLAIALELRYHGLRAPHKVKAAVSGCARECAEARSKDFGIIATEASWNLYVGGNGGFRPRHADLFASDLSTVELIPIVDRFLMFYIRTADRLQRTASWIGAMDGGLAYLRTVIVEDSLGICADLDAAMARHVESYADEWRSTLEDPDRLRRFVSFVNAVTFTSAPAVDALLSGTGPHRAAVLDALRGDVLAACVGPVTAQPLRRHGIPVLEPARARLGALARALVDELPRRAQALRVGGAAVTLRGHAAVVDGELRPLPQAPMAVLRALAAAGGRVLSRAELLSVLPRGADEHAVEMAVARLRSALGGAHYVQTVVKRGYRLRLD